VRRFEPSSLQRVVFAVYGEEARRAFEAVLSS
jgi:O-acetyl-ADP-ribose deacetylase (regulator of RNase III)